MSEIHISQEELDKAKQKIDGLKHNVSQLLIGQEEVIEQVVLAFLAGGHVLLEGVPGLGKTLLIRALAQSLE
jgi:MoxR-like ATPase